MAGIIDELSVPLADRTVPHCSRGRRRRAQPLAVTCVTSGQGSAGGRRRLQNGRVPAPSGGGRSISFVRWLSGVGCRAAGPAAARPACDRSRSSRGATDRESGPADRYRHRHHPAPPPPARWPPATDAAIVWSGGRAIFTAVCLVTGGGKRKQRVVS